jgi:AraC family transcriptional regulator
MKLDKGQYYGDIENTRDIDGIILTTSNYPGNTSLPLHYHKNPYFCFVLNGCYTEHSLKNDLTCKKGDLVFHPGKTEHHNHFGNTAGTCFNIEFSENWTEKIICADLNLMQIESSSESDVQWIASKIFNEFNQYDSLSALMIEGLVTELLVNFSRNKQIKNPAPFYLRKIALFINEYYYTSPSLSGLAGLVQVSPEHLVREFKKNFHITIGDYIRMVRINKACEMLKTTKKELAEIAFDTGFTDQSHFTRVFKKTTGTTPLLYRKSH